MNLTPEQIQAANIREARSSGGCMGAASAVLFCFTLGWMLWSLLGSNINMWGASGPREDGWPLARVIGYWVMVGAVTLAGIWVGSRLGPSLLPSKPSNWVLPTGAAIGLAMEFAFWLCAFGTDQWGYDGWSGAMSVMGKAVSATFSGAIIAIPWGVATAAITRSSLKPRKQGQPRERDFRHPSGGESIEE